MFITFEGPDSSGKSTQAEILKNKLEEEGYKVVKLHFPRYESSIGGFIKSILDGEIEVSFEAMQMLYVADQLDFQETLNNLLKDNYIVIMDRYDLSTLAYYIAKTGATVGEGMQTVYKNWQCKFTRPDVTFIFDANHNITERRDEDSLDILERDNTIADNINTTYLEIAKVLSLFTSRSVGIVNANDSITSISEKIYKDLKEYLN